MPLPESNPETGHPIGCTCKTCERVRRKAERELDRLIDKSVINEDKRKMPSKTTSEKRAVCQNCGVFQMIEITTTVDNQDGSTEITTDSECPVCDRDMQSEDIFY